MGDAAGRPTEAGSGQHRKWVHVRGSRSTERTVHELRAEDERKHMSMQATHTLDPAFLDRLREIRERHRREACPDEPELGCGHEVHSKGLTFCRLMGDECLRTRKVTGD